MDSNYKITILFTDDAIGKEFYSDDEGTLDGDARVYQFKSGDTTYTFPLANIREIRELDLHP